MPALILNIISSQNSTKEIDFFHSNQWNTETENVLLQHIQELIRLVKPVGKELNIQFNIEVTDTNTALFMINRQKNKCPLICQQLTEREKEILNLIMKGFTNSQIAKNLFISIETVRTHRKHLFAKTATKNTATLINYYYQAIAETRIYENLSPGR